MTLDEARTVALAPRLHGGAPLRPHLVPRGRKIFATAPPEGGPLHVFVDEYAVGVAIGMDPQAFEELHWGRKLAGVAVHLARADPEIVRDLLEESWRLRATKRLIRELDVRRENP